MLRGCEVPANRDGSQVIDLRPVRARSHDFAVPVELCCGAAAGAAGEVRFALCRTTREGERAASECRGTGAAAVLMLRGVCHSLGSAYEQRMKLLPKGRGVVVTYTGGIKCNSFQRTSTTYTLLCDAASAARVQSVRVRRGRRARVRVPGRRQRAPRRGALPARRRRIVLAAVRVRARPEPRRRLHATRRRRRRRGRARRRCRRRLVREVGAPPRRDAAPTAPCGAREAGVVRAFVSKRYSLCPGRRSRAASC